MPPDIYVRMFFIEMVRPINDQNVGETETTLKMKKSFIKYPQNEAKIPEKMILLALSSSFFIVRHNHIWKVKIIEIYAARPINPWAIAISK